MIRIGSIVLHVDDLARQAEFWQAALGYDRREDDADGWALLRPPEGDGPNLADYAILADSEGNRFCVVAAR
jgi:hypothetical protein